MLSVLNSSFLATNSLLHVGKSVHLERWMATDSFHSLSAFLSNSCSLITVKV